MAQDATITANENGLMLRRLVQLAHESAIEALSSGGRVKKVTLELPVHGGKLGKPTVSVKRE